MLCGFIAMELALHVWCVCLLLL